MDQTTHEIRRANWISILNQCQSRPLGMTIKQWCSDNDINEKSFFYWQRKFRKETCGKFQPPAEKENTEVAFAEITLPVKLPTKETTPLTTLCERPAAVIKTEKFTLEISNDISDTLLEKLFSEVIHA